MGTRSVTEAMAYIAREIRYGNPFPVGLCKRKTREAYDIPSDGTKTAALAWRNTRHRFHGAWIRGGLIWWVGGSDGAGHVAIMRWRKGHIRTVDHPRAHHWNNSTVDALEKDWPALRFAGTSLDIDGVTVRKMPRVLRRWSHA